MTRTSYFVASSLDGFIADAQGRLDWLFQFDDPDTTAHIARFLDGVGALAMGASTYEFLLRSGEPWAYGARPTWVFTHRTLEPIPGADLRFTQDDVEAVHREMVLAAGERDVWLVGGGRLVADFAQRGLLDEIRVAVMPVTLGAGAPLLPASLTRPFALEEVTRIARDVVELRYDLRSAR